MQGALWTALRLVWILLCGGILGTHGSIKGGGGASAVVRSPEAVEVEGPLGSTSRTELVEGLREKGRTYLSLRDFRNAARCYSAALQVLEGQGGAESGQLRRRCSLTLAECEIKLGNLHSAIARCSDVIEELPPLPTASFNQQSTNVSKEEEELRQACGKAHYRRGIALDRSNLPHLALHELRAAHSNMPADEGVLSRIVSIEAALEEARRGSGGEANSTNTSSSSTADAAGAGTAETAAAAVDESKLDELLHEISEDAQASHPLRRFSNEQILAILRGPASASAPGSGSASVAPLDPLAALAGGMGGMGGMGALGGLGGLGGMGGLGALGGLGGLGALGGLGQAGKNPVEAFLQLASSGRLPGMLSGVGGLLGLEPGTVTLVGDVLKAFADVALLFKRLYELAFEHRVQIVRALLLLLLACKFTPLGQVFSLP